MGNFSGEKSGPKLLVIYSVWAAPRNSSRNASEIRAEIRQEIRAEIRQEIIRRTFVKKSPSFFRSGSSPSKIIRQFFVAEILRQKNVTKIRSRSSIRLRNELAEACHPEARPRTLFPEDLHLYRRRCSPRKPGPKVSFNSRACRQCVLARSFQAAYAGE